MEKQDEDIVTFKSHYIPTIIISGFPCVGKSVACNVFNNVLDSDSSYYSWSKDGIRNPDFPNNYIEHIKRNIGRARWILVSSHKIVRDALDKEGLPYILVYPSRDQKEQYLQRCRNRKNPESFIEMLDKNWDDFITDCEKQGNCEHRVLRPNETLSNVIFTELSLGFIEK
jgi:hypothetical protein